jgi:hypothetical protein
MEKELLETLLARKSKLEKELSHLDALITIHQADLPRGELRIIPQTKPARVRGVYKAAKKAVELFSSEPFDKNQLLQKVVEIDEDFANKISAANIRNALRLMTQKGIIRVETAASATKCATYVRAA